MACRDCAHAGCSLATGVRGGSLAVAKCACGGDLKLRRTPASKFVLGCTSQQCGSAAWFPAAVASARVLEDSDCPQCSAPGAPVRRLKLKLPSAKVPPGTDLNPTLCALCCRGEILHLGFDRRNLRVGGRGRGGRGRGRRAWAGRPHAGGRRRRRASTRTSGRRSRRLNRRGRRRGARRSRSSSGAASAAAVG